MNKDEFLIKLGDNARLLESMTDRQWQRYTELIEMYKGGLFVSCGWTYKIDSQMQMVGCTLEQAQLLADSRRLHF